MISCIHFVYLNYFILIDSKLFHSYMKFLGNTTHIQQCDDISTFSPQIVSFI